MNALATLLGKPDALSARLSVRSIEPTVLNRTVANMPGVAGSTMDAEQTGALQRRIHEAVELGRVEDLKGRDLREACKVFLHTPEPLIENAKTADAIFRRVEGKGQRSALFALVAAYVDGFRDGDPFKLFAQRLRQLLKRWKGRSVEPWAELDESIGLFDPVKAPTTIAAAVLGTERPPLEILGRLGLDTAIRQRGGLAEAAFVEASKIVAAKRGASAIPLQDRMIEWITDAEGRMVFARAFPDAVSALLVPWADVDPPQHHRARLIEVLQSLGGGDPRTKPAAWRAVREQAPAAYAILMRWLTCASVFQFFDIVDRSLAHDPAGRTMWTYRRRFWTAYLLGEEGAPEIEEAWVAFGSDGARLARQAARENSEAGLAAFGTQDDKGSTHAALIMRIGDLVIVDWSHNAKCNFWSKGERGRPELYRSRYQKGDLYSAKEQHSHVAPSSYSWQKTFAAIIEGRRFYSERKSWRPKRV
ncbi:MAG: hypothetical protein K2Y04_11330 [Caulobacteraceae bacterium]|nr:hypothetical protein [Caulobacteraceae bacterium]